MDSARPRHSSRPPRRRFGNPGRARPALLAAGTVTAGAVIFVAPLAVGSVHRPAILLVTGLAALALALVAAAQIVAHSSLRLTSSALLPLAILLVPLLQSLPLPARMAARIDPAGDALLADSPGYASTFRALSLDPPETRAIVGRAGAALALFVLAFHLASGRSRRQLLLRVVAASVLTAFVIGLGHRILGEEKIYGHFSPSRGLLNGPFINSNHTAELMELGVFVCVACALAGASALNRVGWLSAAAMLGAGALGTLSRGAVLGLGTGTILFIALWSRPSHEGAPTGRRGTMFWIGMMLIFLTVVTLGLGADQILTRIGSTRLSQELRFQLWRDTIRILWAHPFGIGRGAFQHVFPVYRTVEAPLSVHFEFAENEPLQYLVEMGWIGFLALVAALALVVREGMRASRRDAVETALVAALAAVLVHNLVDFGLETLGIQIPFAVVLGTLLGRTRNVEARLWSRPRAAMVGATALVAIGIGIGSLAHARDVDFDGQIKSAATPQAKRQIALRAEAAHPVDYFYVLAEAATDPVAPDAGGRSPRLHTLNHALLLCPRCANVHVAVASTLWALGRRSQALGEWRAAIETRPELFKPALEQIWSAGARPEEAAALAGARPDRLIWTASFLADRKQRAYARQLLPIAMGAGAPQLDVLLLQARIDIDEGAIDQSLKILVAAQKLAPQDPRGFLLQADAQLRNADVDKALQAVEDGIRMNPDDLPLQRQRLGIIMRYEKWHLAEHALGGLEVALQQAHQPTAELHLMTARFQAALRNYAKASSEYGLVLTQDRDNPRLWLELAQLCDSAGLEARALEAYREARRIEPANPATIAAIERIESHRRQLRLGTPSP
jgi:O-antigen ligase/tetratricopeptide (TPR) repeat protein